MSRSSATSTSPTLLYASPKKLPYGGGRRRDVVYGAVGLSNFNLLRLELPLDPLGQGGRHDVCSSPPAGEREAPTRLPGQFVCFPKRGSPPGEASRRRSGKPPAQEGAPPSGNVGGDRRAAGGGPGPLRRSGGSPGAPPSTSPTRPRSPDRSSAARRRASKAPARASSPGAPGGRRRSVDERAGIPAAKDVYVLLGRPTGAAYEPPRGASWGSITSSTSTTRSSTSPSSPRPREKGPLR